MVRVPQGYMLLSGLYKLYNDEGKRVGPKTSDKLIKELNRNDEPRIKGFKNIYSVVNIEQEYLEKNIDYNRNLFNNIDLPTLSISVSGTTIDRLLQFNENASLELEKEKEELLRKGFGFGITEKLISYSNVLLNRSKLYRSFKRRIPEKEILEKPFKEWIKAIDNLIENTFIDAKYASKSYFELIYAHQNLYTTNLKNSFFEPEKLLNNWNDAINKTRKDISFKLTPAEKAKFEVVLGHYNEEAAKLHSVNKSSYLRKAEQSFKTAKKLTFQGSKLHGLSEVGLDRIKYLKRVIC